MNKKVISGLLAFGLMMSSVSSYAEVVNAGYEGGIHNNQQDYQKTKDYKEVIFITGKPITVRGKVTVDKKAKKTKYSYKGLKSEDGRLTVTRTLEVDRIIDDTTDEKQTVEQNNQVKLTEKIVYSNPDGTRIEYDLIDSQLHGSTADDQQPVVDYYMGGWQWTKIYSVNDGIAYVQLDSTGNIYGYNHYWGSTETQEIINYVELRNKRDASDPKKSIVWAGDVEMYTSYNKTKEMEYMDNKPYQSSFEGGYTLIEGEETVMEYVYDISNSDPLAVNKDARIKGKGVERFETLPTRKSLYKAKYEDIKGNIFEKDVKRLAGLKVIDGNKKYFAPNLNMKRSEFAKWVAKAMDLKLEKKVDRSFVKKENQIPMFSDVREDDPDFAYIEAVKKSGIMYGTDDNRFLPDGELTRQEAITILMRALGMRIAPTPSFNTGFKDDKNISEWAKKYVYTAKEIGLVKGTTEGYVYPNSKMTRGEAAAFLNRFISYMQTNMRNEYRESLMEY